MPDTHSYVIVTPARNEAQFIELTLKSVIAQTARPIRWVIVSDGSTDGTDAIVSRYAADHSWIELLALPDRQSRDFAGKARAFNWGYERVKDLPYCAIASLDADVSFAADQFEFLLARLEADPALGLVGVPFQETSGETYDFRFSSVEHVSGACQLFRRECFDAIGGYAPIPGGGIDLVAVVTARMKGWKTRTYPERTVLHHRVMSSATSKGLSIRFKQGERDYRLGGNPLWQIFRGIYQMSRRPYILGGLAILAGFFTSRIARRPRSVSPEFARFRSGEQLQRLKEFFVARLPLPRLGKP